MARKGKRRNDFVVWIEEGLGLKELAAKVGAVNPYATSLEGVRKRLINLCEQAEREGH